MHAIVFEGTSEEQHSFIVEEQTKLMVMDIDITTLLSDENSIGIKEIKLFVQSLLLKPLGETRFGVIHSAEKLTIESQNALLKTLEEPPKQVLLYLLTTQKHTLLPTILSRCIVQTKIKKQELSNEITESINNYFQEPLSNKLIIHDSWITNKESALQWIYNLLLYCRSQNDTTNTTQIYKRIKKLIQMKQLLEANVTPKSVFDTFAISL